MAIIFYWNTFSSLHEKGDGSSSRIFSGDYLKKGSQLILGILKYEYEHLKRVHLSFSVFRKREWNVYRFCWNNNHSKDIPCFPQDQLSCLLRQLLRVEHEVIWESKYNKVYQQSCTWKIAQNCNIPTTQLMSPESTRIQNVEFLFNLTYS